MDKAVDVLPPQSQPRSAIMTDNMKTYSGSQGSLSSSNSSLKSNRDTDIDNEQTTTEPVATDEQQLLYSTEEVEIQVHRQPSLDEGCIEVSIPVPTLPVRSLTVNYNPHL